MIIHPRDLPKMGFGAGARSLWRAIGYLFRHPTLFKYVIPSVLVNGAVVVLLMVGLWSLMGYMDASIDGWEAGAAGHWYVWLIKILSWIYFFAKTAVVVLTVYFVVPPLYVILMNLNPLSAVLSNLTFKYVFNEQVGHKLPEAEPGGGIGVAHSVLIEIRKLLVFLIQMLGALSLNLIPYIGTIFSAVACYFITIQTSGWALVTPYYEALGYNYKLQRGAFRRQRKLAWGLGTMFELILLIPVVNILTLFVGYIGGALVCAQVEKERLAQPVEAPEE